MARPRLGFSAMNNRLMIKIQMVEKTKATLSNVALRNQEKLYKITVSPSKTEKDRLRRVLITLRR